MVVKLKSSAKNVVVMLVLVKYPFGRIALAYSTEFQIS